MSILYEFGKYGPILLIILSWYLLWNNKNLFFYYNIGIFTNAIINIIFNIALRDFIFSEAIYSFSVSSHFYI